MYPISSHLCDTLQCAQEAVCQHASPYFSSMISSKVPTVIGEPLRSSTYSKRAGCVSRHIARVQPAGCTWQLQNSKACLGAVFLVALFLRLEPLLVLHELLLHQQPVLHSLQLEQPELAFCVGGDVGQLRPELCARASPALLATYSWRRRRWLPLLLLLRLRLQGRNTELYKYTQQGRSLAWQSLAARYELI